MEKLFNLAYHECSLEVFNNDYSVLEKFLTRHNLDGVELFLPYNTFDCKDFPKEFVRGVHLHYNPMWVDAYKGNSENLLFQCGSNENARILFGENFIENIKKRYIRESKMCQWFGAEYSVFHVADIGLDEVFRTKPYRYSNKEVLDCSVELINSIYDDRYRNCTLAFENLWWPGLNFESYKETKEFFDRIICKNKGFVLDVGHVMINAKNIYTEKDASRELIRRIHSLSTLRDRIKVMHLNCALSESYKQRDLTKEYQQFLGTMNVDERFCLARNVVTNLDTHLPFLDESINDVIRELNLEFIVLELGCETLKDLDYCISRQLEYLE